MSSKLTVSFEFDLVLFKARITYETDLKKKQKRKKAQRLKKKKAK